MLTGKYKGKKYILQFLDNEILLYDDVTGGYVKTLLSVVGITDIEEKEISPEYIKHVGGSIL